MTDRKRKSRGHRRSEINLAIFLFQSSYQGNYKDLKDVITSDKIKNEKRWLALNAHDAEGTPILVNCIKGAATKRNEHDYLECIKMLTQTGIPLDSKDKQSKTALHWSIVENQFEICKYLLEQGAKDMVADFKIGRYETALSIAIRGKKEKFAKLLCTYTWQKELLEHKDSNGMSLLFLAMSVGSPQIFLQLLETGADPHGETIDGKSLIAHTIEQNATKYLKLLLQFRVSFFSSGNQRTAIHLAANQKDAVILKLLAEQCSVEQLQCRDEHGKTPLMYAVSNERTENVQTLLDANVDITQCSKDGKTALHMTSYNTETNCLDMLIKEDETLLDKSDNSQLYPIHTAISVGNNLILKRMLEYGANINVVDKEGHTLIHFATEYASTGCLMELVRAGLPVNTPDNYGVYPIHYAVNASSEGVEQARLSFLQQLVQTDVNLKVVDDQGCQPIHWAVCTGNVESLKILLMQDVNVNAEAKDDALNCLHLSCKFQKLPCLEVLLDYPNVSVDQVDRSGRSALFYACEIRSSSKYTEALVNAGANCNLSDFAGYTPVHTAVMHSSIDSLWLLSLKRANLNKKNKLGETPMHIACSAGDEVSVRFLMSRNCDVNAVQLNGTTPLHLCVTRKNLDLTQLFLQRKANCNLIMHGKDDYTPLDLALENGDYNMIKLLRSYGAQTGHCIQSNAAIIIQHCWKKYAKHNSSKLDHLGSTCNSSNVSESVSVLETKRDGRVSDPVNFHRPPDNQPQLYCAKNKMDHVHEKNPRFQQQLENGAYEIRMMRELMKETERLLVKSKHITREADLLINSSAFRTMKLSTKRMMSQHPLEKVVE